MFPEYPAGLVQNRWPDQARISTFVILLVIAVANREMRIELANPVLHAINDEDANAVIQQMLPHMKKNDFKHALLVYLDAMETRIKKYDWNIYPLSKTGKDEVKSNKILSSKISLGDITTDEGDIFYKYGNTDLVLHFVKYQGEMVQSFFIDKHLIGNALRNKLFPPIYNMYFYITNQSVSNKYYGNLVYLAKSK